MSPLAGGAGGAEGECEGDELRVAAGDAEREGEPDAGARDAEADEVTTVAAADGVGASVPAEPVADALAGEALDEGDAEGDALGASVAAALARAEPVAVGSAPKLPDADGVPDREDVGVGAADAATGAATAPLEHTVTTTPPPEDAAAQPVGRATPAPPPKGTPAHAGDAKTL